MKKFAYKYRWLLSFISVIALLLILGVWVANKVTRDLKGFTFRNYLIFEYMPSQKKMNKEWPSTLDDFSQQVEGSDTIIKDLVIEYHDRYFIKIKSVLKCNNSYVFRVFTKDGAHTCKATVDSDGGYCWSSSD